MKKTVLLFVLFLGTLTLGMAQSKENNFLDQPYIEVTGTAMMEVVPDEIYHIEGKGTEGEDGVGATGEKVVPNVTESGD